MLVIRPPALVPTLFATLGLFRHAHRGLADPAQLPYIERELPVGRLDPQWLQAYHGCIGLRCGDADMLPPLALQIAAAPLHMAILADARFPFPAMGLVHMSQGVTQTQPIPAGARLGLRAFTSDARREKRGMSFGLVTEARLDGQVVWRGETRALALDRSGQSAASGGRGKPTVSPAKALVLRSETVLQVPESCGRSYAAIAGDLNPIHQRAWMARLFGFRRAIVHGTWTLARALVEADLSCLPAYTLEADFRRPVELPSEILIRAFTDGQAQHRVEVSRPGVRQTVIDVRLSTPVER